MLAMCGLSRVGFPKTPWCIDYSMLFRELTLYFYTILFSFLDGLYPWKIDLFIIFGFYSDSLKKHKSRACKLATIRLEFVHCLFCSNFFLLLLCVMKGTQLGWKLLQYSTFLKCSILSISFEIPPDTFFILAFNADSLDFWEKMYLFCFFLHSTVCIMKCTFLTRRGSRKFNISI